MFPTAAQASKCYLVCYALTKMYQPIFLVRIDERTGNLFILAGDDIEILIDPDGELIYDNAT
ncbi:DUF6888 family protein [Coleofasciculus chthonoplastes]